MSRLFLQGQDQCINTTCLILEESQNQDRKSQDYISEVISVTPDLYLRPTCIRIKSLNGQQLTGNKL